MPGNLPNLQKATAARTAAATARAEAALTAMIKAGEPVTFRGLAARAGSPWTSSTATPRSAPGSNTTAPRSHPGRSPLPPPSPARTLPAAWSAR